MRFVFAALMMVLAGSAMAETPAGDVKEVTVLGRDWLVWPSARVPGEYVARRQNTELLALRPPAVLTVRQAVRAYHTATGCSANYDSIYRSINGDYHTVLVCPR